MALNISLESLLGEELSDEQKIEEIRFNFTFDFLTEIYLRMKELGINQKELAHRLDISESTLSRTLSRDGNLRVSTLAKIANALGCTISSPKLVANKDAISLDTIETVEMQIPEIDIDDEPQKSSSEDELNSLIDIENIVRLAS